MRFVLATAFVAATLSAGHAADLTYESPAIPAYAPAPMSYDWRGLWIGAHAGYVFGNLTGNVDGFEADGPSGFDGGFHAYYNFQSPQGWVVGPYLAVPLVTAKGTIGGGAQEVKLDWAVVGGARLGYAFDRFLPYVLAGGVVGGASLPGIGLSNTHAGFTVGAGFDYAVGYRWSLGARYAFVSMEKKDYAGVGPYGWDGHSIVGTATFRLK